jgi:hypothetical protein
VEAVEMENQAKRVHVQIAALAKDYGIKMPAAKDVD